MRIVTLNSDCIGLLEWLGMEEYSQYGECHGESLDHLIANGLAQVHDPTIGQGGFIAKGVGLMYRAVSLTDKGRELLAAMKEKDDDGEDGR